MRRNELAIKEVEIAMKESEFASVFCMYTGILKLHIDIDKSQNNCTK